MATASNGAGGFSSLHDPNRTVGDKIENHLDRDRQQGKAWYDIAWLWEELGISRREA